MKAQICSAIGGVLIVSLALTAGRQYALNQRANPALAECNDTHLRTSEMLTETQARNTALLRQLEAQTLELQRLRSLQLHELPSGRTILIDPTAPMHNDAGGYIAACGSLPGLVGDDC